jgi:hypothetical protein
MRRSRQWGLSVPRVWGVEEILDAGGIVFGRLYGLHRLVPHAPGGADTGIEKLLAPCDASSRGGNSLTTGSVALAEPAIRASAAARQHRGIRSQTTRLSKRLPITAQTSAPRQGCQWAFASGRAARAAPCVWTTDATHPPATTGKLQATYWQLIDAAVVATLLNSSARDTSPISARRSRTALPSFA